MVKKLDCFGRWSLLANIFAEGVVVDFNRMAPSQAARETAAAQGAASNDCNNKGPKKQVRRAQETGTKDAAGSVLVWINGVDDYEARNLDNGLCLEAVIANARKKAAKGILVLLMLVLGQAQAAGSVRHANGYLVRGTGRQALVPEIAKDERNIVGNRGKGHALILDTVSNALPPIAVTARVKVCQRKIGRK